jgi:hypothetical protein
MTAIAFRRNPLPVLGSLQLENWTQETSDRGGQDKARKVRAVGRREESSDFNHAPNILRLFAHLAIFGNTLSPLNYRHPTSQT